MERFYGQTLSVGLSNEDAQSCLTLWHEIASETAKSADEQALVDWLSERLNRRTFGSRGFRLAPAPEPIAATQTRDFFARVISASAVPFTQLNATLNGRQLDEPSRLQWLSVMLDLLSFANEARGRAIDDLAPEVATADQVEVTLRRMWARYTEAARMENLVFRDDPRYPDPERLLEYLDRILDIAVGDGRESLRAWPFPKILWEREILLEKLGRMEELAETMRRSAALEDESFRRQTEEYLAVVVAQ